MKKEFDYKLVLKKILYKIKFKITAYTLTAFIIIGLIMLPFANELIHSLGILISSSSVLLLSFLYFLFCLKNIIDDIDKMFYGVFVMFFLLFLFTATTILFSKFIYAVIPIYYKDGNKDVTDLLFSTYSSVIAAVIGIGGTYLGAVYGGKKSIETTKLQLDQQATDNENRRKDNERFALRIVSKLLSQEINYNLDSLNNNKFFSSLRFENNVYYSTIHEELKFDIYNNTKYELIKYSSNDSLVEEVIDVYGLLEILKKYDNLNKMTKKDFDKILTLKSKINHLVESIDKITLNND